MNDIATRYDPRDSEDAIYAFWEKEGFFHADPSSGKKPYTIVIPPPNVTGILHMGHALNNTIQDILVRFKRMQGYEALWMPGTDHAGIATQNVVEKKLRKEGRRREDLGREAFLKEVWSWRESYGSTIIAQLKKLGSSCDWARTRFTMDEGLSAAVQEVFIRLYEKGLIYQGSYIINWCPRCATALSDEEGPHRLVDGGLYHITYPLAGGGEGVVVATTRPETMLGDVAVCVHPADERYRRLRGKKLLLPLIGRELAVIEDEAVDPAFGTGALKVTPAHDPVDFELARRHGLAAINVMNPDGTINANGGPYRGLDRFAARKKIIEDLTVQGLFVKQEKHQHAVGHCYRCDTVIEPRLSKQWFVRMRPLAEPATKAVERGEILFYPKRWTKVYLNWMEHIRDWCISRQIWWGHRIPVYYCRSCQPVDADERPDQDRDRGTRAAASGVIVSRTKPARCPACKGTDIVQDPDVLDTWFSSWLWPFSTLGWPAETPELKTFYPTNTLVTASEIIFFWVARMIMAGIEFKGAAPFTDVYIHGTVRDDSGKKMSKSLGNIIDPLEVIAEFGADALRFSIISITAQGQDVYLSKEKFHIGRNFANKIWNASRYILMNLPSRPLRHLPRDLDRAKLSLADKWILTRLAQVREAMGADLDAYRINEAASAIYDFFWHQLCDWYLEISKLDAAEDHKHDVLYAVFYTSLKLLHPFVPFITEQIWQMLPQKEAVSVMVSSWPSAEEQRVFPEADEMQRVIDVVSAVRNIRSEWNIPPKTSVGVSVVCANGEVERLMRREERVIARLGGIGTFRAGCGLGKPKQAAAVVLTGLEVFVDLAGIIDIERERESLRKKIEERTRHLQSLETRLSNPTFVEKAPEEVVAQQRATRAELEGIVARLRANLESLQGDDDA